MKNNTFIFSIILLTILYAKDFTVLANIILASAIITLVFDYIIKKLKMEEMLQSKMIRLFIIFVLGYTLINVLM